MVFFVEADRKRAAAHDVEGVDNVIKAVSDRGQKELVARRGAVVIGAAGVEKAAAAAGHLLGRVRDVLAEVARKGLGKRLEGDFRPAGERELEKGLREGELVGRDISAE